MGWTGVCRVLRHAGVMIVLFLMGLECLSTWVLANDAAVLRKGGFQFQVDNHFYFRTDDRFNQDGDKEEFATPFNAIINENVFPGLSFFSGPPFFVSDPTLGETKTNMDWLLVRMVYQVAYGLTDQITVGIRWPWIWVKNKVDFAFDSSGSDVNMGLNPGLVSPDNPLGFAPLSVPGTSRVTTDDAQDALNTLGFKDLEDFERSGFEDLEIGGRWQYFRNDLWRLAFTGGVRLPTGRKDDPENLGDVAFGSGAYALLFRLNQDLTLFQEEGPLKRFGFLTPGALIVNTSFYYDLYLPDRQRLRVTSINDPLGGEFDYVKRNLGDVFRAEISPKVGLVKGLTAWGMYQYTHKFKDHYSGNKDLPYDDIAIGTKYNEHIYLVGLSFTTLPWVLEKSFPLPLGVDLYYRERFAADSFLWVSKFIGFKVSVFL